MLKFMHKSSKKIITIFLSILMIMVNVIGGGFQVLTVKAETETSVGSISVSEMTNLSASSSGITKVLSPDYRSDINENNITVEFENGKGSRAIVYAQKQPGDLSINSNGSRTVVAEVDIVNGRGSFLFPASEYPKGPISLRIHVLDENDNVVDDCYLQLYNNVGVAWKTGLENAPENPVTAGMQVTYFDDFKTMPSINRTGIGADYASAKVDEARGGMFGWAAFEDYDGPYNPFSIVDNEYMMITTTYHPTGYVNNDYWKQKMTTGYLSSMAQDGTGFKTRGGTNQYFECRMFCGPNPGMWPAFWLLTANGYVQNSEENKKYSDELDIIEGYLGTPGGYQIAWHQWGYDTKLGGGLVCSLETEEFSNINLAMGFHTFGVYITQNTTYYYCDNNLVASHKTLPYSWEYGNYFIINAAVSDHYGIDGNAEDPFENFEIENGFTRYGNECYTYIDWVRVYEDLPGTVRFEADKLSVNISAGNTALVRVYRNDAAKELAGDYEISMPEGWEVFVDGEFIVTDRVSFTSGISIDELVFKAPAGYSDVNGQIVITPVVGDTRYLASTITVKLDDEENKLVRVDRTTYKYVNKSGGTNGPWSDYDPSTNDVEYFNFIDGGWWSEGWSWMHDRVSNNGYFTFTFTGNSIKLYTIDWDGGGKIDIYLDGVYQTTYDTYSAVEKSNQLAFSASGLEEKQHVLMIKTVPQENSFNMHNRIDAFEYTYHEDPTIPKFTLETPRFEPKAGDIIDIKISRNGAALTTFGTYEIELPSSDWQVVSGSTFTTNKPTDTIRIKVPENNFVGRADIIKIIPTIDGKTYGVLKVTVKAPDPEEAPDITITGERVSVNSSTYPYVSNSGETSGSWQNFNEQSQPVDYFEFNGGWWCDSWSWMYTRASVGQTIDFTFEGAGVALYANYNEDGTSFDVYLDGVKQGSYNTYGNSGRMRIFSIDGLTPAYHTLQIVVTSNTGVVSLSGFEYDYVKSLEPQLIQVNAYTYPYKSANGETSGSWAAFDSTTQDIQYFTFYTGSWWSDSWGWMYMHANKGSDGGALEFRFNGTAVSVLMRTYDSGGKLKVYLDGDYVTTIDSQTSETINDNKVFTKTGLRNGSHVLKLVVDGDDSRGDVIISGFEYLYDPTAEIATFEGPASVDVIPGENVEIKITRNEAAQALEGVYSVEFPSGEGWSVVSGSEFVAGSATDTIVVHVSPDYTSQKGVISITPVTTGNVKYPVVNIKAVAPKTYLRDIVSLISPEYRSEIDGITTMNFIAPGGYTTAAAYAVCPPDDSDSNPYGRVVTLAEVDLNASGEGSFTFDADIMPHGPVCVKIVATKDDGVTTCDGYFQFYNNGGIKWNTGLENAPTPAQIQGRNMVLTFYDDFKTMPAISATGKDSNGNRTTYTSHKPDYKDYGDALFAPYEGPYNPFEHVEDYLKITTTKYDEKLPASVDYWQRYYTTGFLSSLGDDGQGFKTKGYVDQYFECRFFIGPNPEQWPAFWTLSSLNSNYGTDELDIIEAYPPTLNGYSIASHQWDYSTGLGGGTQVNTEELLGGLLGNLAMGFHTYGCLITEEYTAYYFDNIEVYREKTLPYAWRDGNFFMVNNAMQLKGFAEGYGFDRYGNQSEMYIDWIRVYEGVQDDVIFDTTDVGAVKVTPGQNVTIKIDRVTSGAQELSGEYEITMPSDWSVVSGVNFTAGKSRDEIVLHVPESYVKYSFDLKITPVASDGTKYKTITVPTVNTDNSLAVEIYPVLNHNGNGWSVAVALKNTRTSGTLDGGKINLLAPESVAAEYTFESIPAGETKITLIPADILSVMDLTEFTFNITRYDGYDRTFTKKISCLTATRTNADVPILPDGILQPDEWAGAMEIQLGEKQYVATGSTTWGGMNDHSAKLYTKWDDENLYIAVEVTDDVHYMEVSDVYSSWGSDSLQISFDPLRAEGYGADNNHIRFIASYNAQTDKSSLGVESWGPISDASLDDITYKFTRDEVSKKTIYEIAFPWESILTTDRLPARANLTDVGISVLVNDNDTNGRKGWLKYMDGIATGKDPSQFGDLILSNLSRIDLGGDETNPGTSLKGILSVKTGQEFDITVGLTNVKDSVYAEDITIGYDQSLFEFAGLKTANEQTIIVGVDNEVPGKVRVFTINTQAVNGDIDLLIVTFKAKEVTKTTAGNISIVKAELGIAPEGKVVNAETSTVTVNVYHMKEDLNQDGVVNVADLAIAAYYYRADSSSENWNEAKIADVNDDGVVDILDISAIANKVLGK